MALFLFSSALALALVYQKQKMNMQTAFAKTAKPAAKTPVNRSGAYIGGVIADKSAQ